MTLKIDSSSQTSSLCTNYSRRLEMFSTAPAREVDAAGESSNTRFVSPELAAGCLQ